MALLGVVLAGGQGLRVGGADKGLLLFHGRPLVDHVLSRMQPQVAQLTISANRNLAHYGQRGHAVFTDDPQWRGAGPMAGLLGALRQARARQLDWVWTCPCDTPNVPLDLAARLVACLTTRSTAVHRAAGAVPVVEGQWQPAHALLNASMLEPLEAALESGQRRLQAWLATQSVVPLICADTQAFANLNHFHQGLEPAPPDRPDRRH
jgi:molybdenum cofactor guanylyltransferase